MLSKSKIKYIQSLNFKKYRDTYQQFIVEGEKIVTEVLHKNNTDFKIDTLIATQQYINLITSKKIKSIGEIIEAKSNEIKKISSLKTPGNVVALASYSNKKANKKEIESTLSLVLENIQDPGNLGTIIRTADWFGIKNIFCSLNCVDMYNPKVIQSTMGSFLRVQVYYTDLIQLIKVYSTNNFLTFGAFLTGKSLYTENLTSTGFIVLGNESQGISPELEKLITHKIFIPPYPDKSNTAESINIASATAIICAEFRRRIP